MADASHLERMGRELKCPICLSLLDSAASLTCNHVFCNLCIHKSMKSGSNCPVCKTPYQRREIRPAPHMDNLVKIYKSMEVASGLSLFVTQNPAAIKCLEKQTESDGHVAEEESGLKTPKTVKHRIMEGPLSKRLSKSKPKNSGRNRGKPSFLTNKRVQVPQSPISTETPVRQAKNEHRKLKTINELMNNSSSSPHGQQLSNGKRSPNLSPFFWLQDDEDVEKPSQPLEMDHLTGTPAKAPSFSDIKDSDDDVPSKMSPREGTLRRCNSADLFDSEMFEWTQRACSPELCSSPVKLQVTVGHIGEHNKRLENFEELLEGAVANNEVTTEHLDNISSMENNNTQHVEPHNSSSPQNKSDHKQNESVIPCKRGRKTSNKSHSKRRKSNVGQVRDAPNGPELALGSSKENCSPKARCIQSPDSASPDEVNDLVSELPALDSKRGISEDKKLKKSKKKFKSMRQSSRFGRVQRNKNKQNIMTPSIINEAIVHHERRHEDAQSKSHLSMAMPDKKSCCPKRKTTSCAANHQKKRNCRQRGCEMKDKVSEDNFCGQKAERNGNVGDKAAEQADGDNAQEVPMSSYLAGSLTKGEVYPQKDKPSLHKCDVRSTKCAFCHSTEETEASGELVRYSEGRAVSENHAGSGIASHRNCTEWAPNVYFENDIAVNLEEELTRSRRIKCSLCGVKGAALGCYEKSCRKSFHVPCAKKLRECRWDNEHFVILCPLHASSKLPCECSTSGPTKVKSNQKGKNPQRQTQLGVNNGTKRNLKNFDRSSEKVVLCCSGLSATEKETVSEFAKASGALVLTTWNSAVTHVIASVDANEACRRTLKVLMGILEGKWILTIKWVEACTKAVALVDEAPYEISRDIHGVKYGPRLGRLRHQNKEPKLFAGFKFYLSGDFAPSYKGYLQDLLIAAGGTILQRKPIAESNGAAASVPPTIIIYSVELPEKCDVKKKDMTLARRRSDAEVLASATGSKVADNLWALKCIAGHKLQDL